MTTRPDPIQPATEEALALARQLLTLGHAALSWSDPDTRTPRGIDGEGGCDCKHRRPGQDLCPFVCHHSGRQAS